MGQKVVCGSNIETTAVNFYKVSVRIDFESEGKITPPSTATCRFVTETNVSIFLEMYL
jgi:hypothetical protein